MRRIVVAEWIHEVCTFNPAPTRAADYFVHQGDAILSYHKDIGSEVNGACDVFAQAGNLEVIPAYSARGVTSGGLQAAEDWIAMSDAFLHAIRNSLPVQGVYLALHGAMAAENEWDPEGYLLAETRKLVGETVPIVASYDLHGILTDRMLEHADATVVFHTYPHVDFYETGRRAANLLLRIMNHEVRPVTARVFIPALVRGDELITATGVFGQVINRARAIENDPQGLSAGMFIGNPFTDVPELGCSSMVIMDHDSQRAQHEAIQLAQEFWSHRERMQALLTGLEESIRLALSTPATVVLVDAADATSSGAPGDSNAILRELIEAGYTQPALIPMVDPQGVAAAFAAGIGQTVTTQLGGAVDSRWQPIEVSGRVRMLSDGQFRSESFGQLWNSGPTAVLEVGSIIVIVTSRPVHLFDRSLFYAHGQDPKNFHIVVVKSPHCQSHMFADWCQRLIPVDAPGATSANLRTLPYQRCPRPLYPLDAEVPFVPQVRLFGRSIPSSGPQRATP